MTRVKVWPTVPIKVREAAEKTAGKNLTQGRPGDPKKVNDVLAGWLVDVVALRSAKTELDALTAAERLRGKPLVLPTVAT